MLKAGLDKKAKVAKVAEVARAQDKARHAKGPSKPNEIQLDEARARSEKVERDRALAAKHNAKLRVTELATHARQITEDKKVARTGEVECRFTADGAIRTLLVNEDLRKMLSSGALVIVRLDDRYELLPGAAGDQVRQRHASLIVLDHGQEAGAKPAARGPEDDAYYVQLQVPDDLDW